MGIKTLFEKIDLSKKLPKGYLNFKLIRSVWLIVLILGTVAFATNGFQKQIYWFECEEADGFCNNPFYDEPKLCEIQPDLCEYPFAYKGEVIGQKPTWLYLNFKTLAFFLIAGVYTLNHLLWRRKNAN